MTYNKFSPESGRLQGLAWGMHAQFREYIERMSDGTMTVADGAEPLESGEVFFPIEDQRTDDALCFTGALQFTGHHGMLVVTIQNPWLEFAAETTALSITDPFDPTARMELVTLQLNEDGTGQTQLTEEGTDLFMGNYHTGTTFDPVRIVWVGKE